MELRFGEWLKTILRIGIPKVSDLWVEQKRTAIMSCFVKTHNAFERKYARKRNVHWQRITITTTLSTLAMEN